MIRKITTLSLLLSLLLFSTSALALGPVDISLETDYASRYIWRGFDVYGNGDAFQPSGALGYSISDDLSVSVATWASYDVDMGKTWDEIDYTADLSYTIDDTFSVAAGYIYYHWFADGDADTQEVWGSVSAALPYDLSCDLAVYYDYDEGDGWYTNLGLGYGRDFTDSVSFSAGVNAGYGNYDDEGYMAGFDGIQDVNLSFGFDVDLGYSLALTTSATYTIVPDSDINEDNEFSTIVGLIYEL